MADSPPHPVDSAPLVTLGVPVYNGGKYLAECLQSILGQTFERFEVVISDNASTDDTEEICEEFARRDPRIRYTRQAYNQGAARNYNFVFGQARTRYFRWAAHDDLLQPRLLEACVEALEADVSERFALAWPGTELVRVDGSFERPSDDVEQVVTQRPPWVGDTPRTRIASLLGDDVDTLLYKCEPVFGLMRTKTLRSTRLIQAFNSSDKVLLVELALRGDFLEIPETLFTRRSHPGTSLNANRTPEAVMAWFDPTRAAAPPMPRLRLFRGYLTAILEAPLAPGERLSALRTLWRWVLHEKHWWDILDELRSRLRGALGRGPR